MKTRSQQTHGNPAPLVTEMVARWRPGREPRDEATRLAAEALAASKMSCAQVHGLCVAARPAEAALWQDVFVHHRDRLALPPSQLPTPKLEAEDFTRTCARIASCVRVNELVADHGVYRSFFRHSFGLDDVPAAQQHIVSLVDPTQGQHLAEYLGIGKDRLLCLKTGSSVRRHVGTLSTLKSDSSLLRNMRNKIGKYDGLEAMAGGSVTVLGHYSYDKKEGRPQCGFLRAKELLNLFPDGLRPRVLNLFCCGSESFAKECAELLAPDRVTINYVQEDMQVNLHQLKAEGFVDPDPAAASSTGSEHRVQFFYYGGPDVAVDGAIGKLFGPKQQDAWRFFRRLEVGERNS